ncbi:hypothetical protein RUND412_010288 [Rhizina undulata]
MGFKFNNDESQPAPFGTINSFFGLYEARPEYQYGYDLNAPPVVPSPAKPDIEAPVRQRGGFSEDSIYTFDRKGNIVVKGSFEHILQGAAFGKRAPPPPVASQHRVQQNVHIIAHRVTANGNGSSGHKVSYPEAKHLRRTSRQSDLTRLQSVKECGRCSLVKAAVEFRRPGENHEFCQHCRETRAKPGDVDNYCRCCRQFKPCKQFILHKNEHYGDRPKHDAKIETP